MVKQEKRTIIKATLHKNQTGFTNRVISIPDAGIDFYARIIHDSGRIELIPMEMIETSTGAGNAE